MKKIFTSVAKVLKDSKGLRYTTILGAAVILAIVGFSVYASTYSYIFPNVYIESTSIGGKTKEQAIALLAEKFDTEALGERTITFECKEHTKAVKLSQMDTRFDFEKTVQDAYDIGRNGRIFKKSVRLLASAFKKTKIPVEVLINEEKLNGLITELAADFEVEPEKTGYTVSGNKLTIEKGHGGKRIDRKKALRTVKKAVTDPECTKVSFKIEKVKEPPVNVDEIYKELTAEPRNAEYKLVDGTVNIVDGKAKVMVDRTKLKNALTSDDEKVVLDVTTEEPKITAEHLKMMLFRDVLGTYSSSFASSTAARASNVTLAAQRINGYVLMPGEVFSYDKTIGRRTAANGYKEAGVYIGNKVESGIGGGICQTSSTLYSAALYANLQIVSRTSHSLPVSYVPLGQDATIAEGYIDLKLKNNTEYPVKIVASVNGRRLTCSILGVKEEGQSVEISNTTISTEQPKVERRVNNDIPQGYKRIINKGAPGYTVASVRIVRKNGEVIKNENLTKSVYRAAPVEEEVNPADKQTPSENLQTYKPGMTVPAAEPEPESTSNQTPEQPAHTPQTESKPKEGQTTENTAEI